MDLQIYVSIDRPALKMDKGKCFFSGHNNDGTKSAGIENKLLYFTGYQQSILIQGRTNIELCKFKIK